MTYKIRSSTTYLSPPSLQLTYVDFYTYEMLDVLRTFDGNIYGTEMSNLSVSSACACVCLWALSL